MPYAASASNVFVSNPWDPEPVPAPAFVGREVRWHWRDLEPTVEDDLHLAFVWPGLWQEILDLEAETGENPADVEAAIALAEDYREAGSERHGFMVSSSLYHLSRTAIEEALAYNPGSLDLRIELASIEAWRCESYPPCSLEEVAANLEIVDRLIEANPSVQQLLDIQSRLQSAAQQAAAYASRETQMVIATPTPTTEATAVTVIPAASPSVSTPTSTPAAVVIDSGPEESPWSLEPLSSIAGIAVGIAATLVFGALRMRRASTTQDKP
jgi:hypothetical protein